MSEPPVVSSPAGFSAPSGETGQAPPAAKDIDLEALAEKVFRLLKQQARLERERLGRRPLG